MGDRTTMQSHSLPILPPFNPDRSTLPPLRSMFGDILSNDTSRQATRRASVTDTQPPPPFYRDPHTSQSRARSRTDAAYTTLNPPQPGFKRLSPRTSPRMLPYARPSSGQGSPRILTNMPPPPPLESHSRSRSPSRKHEPVYGAPSTSSSTSYHVASSPRTMPMMIPSSSSSNSSSSRRNDSQPFLVGRSLPTQSLYSYDPNSHMLSPRPISTNLQPAKFSTSSRSHERGSSGDDGDNDAMDVDRDGSDLISPISGYGEEDGEEDEEDGGASDGGDDPERKHVCSRCSKRFNRPSSLKTHLHTHSGAKPFRCPHPSCGRLFNVNSNMRRHFRTHGPHPPRPRTAPIRRTTPNVPVPGSTAPNMPLGAGGAQSRLTDDYAHPPYPTPGAHPLVGAETHGLSGPGALPSLPRTAGTRPVSVVTAPGFWATTKKANSPGAVKAEREVTLAALMTAAMG